MENSETNYDSLKNNESIKSDKSLQKLIKEIDEIKDTKDKNDDKIDNILKDGESVEGAESPSKILDKGLSKSLMKCDEAVLDTLIKEVESLLASNPNVEGLSDLSDLLKEVKENREKGNEDSFNKFKDIINKGKLSDLNSLKNEVQNIISFVNDDGNNMSTLNLYANMVSLSPDAYKSFKGTDREVFKSISDAIRSHFNMPEGAGVETVKDLQLGEIFKDVDSKDELTNLYKNYIGENWNGENIEDSDEGKFKEGVNVVISYPDFAKKFNEINGSIQTENNEDNNGEKLNESEEGKGGFEDVDIKEGLAVDEINKYITDNGGKDIFRKKEQGEGEEKEKGGYECNMENIKDFLKKIGNDITFDKNFIAVKTPSRKAWLSTVQILLNKEHEGTLKVDGQYVKGGETYTAVKDFQEKYNTDNNLKEGDEGYLVPDGIPGPLTLGKLLGTNDEKQKEGEGQGDGDKQKEGEGQGDGDKQKEGEGQGDGDKQKEGEGQGDGDKQKEGEGQGDGDKQKEGEGQGDGDKQKEGVASAQKTLTREDFAVKNPQYYPQMSGENLGEGDGEVINDNKGGIEGVGKLEGGKFIFNEGVEQTDENGRLYVTFNGEKYIKFSNIGLSEGESGKVYQEVKNGIYFGEIKGGEYKRSGSGTMLFSNGDVFTGNWENGSPNGEGTLTKSDGTKISGNWKNGEFVKEDEDGGKKTDIKSESRNDFANAVQYGTGVEAGKDGATSQIEGSSVSRIESQKQQETAGDANAYEKAGYNPANPNASVDSDSGVVNTDYGTDGWKDEKIRITGSVGQ